MKWILVCVVCVFTSRLVAQDLENSLAPSNSVQLRIAGSSLVTAGGAMLGNIEAVVLDPSLQQLTFALVSTSYPSNRLVVTPVPWRLLRHHTDGRESSGVPGTFQQFRTHLDRMAILRAPRVQLNERTNDAAWMLASAQYFDSVGTGVGTAAAGTASETGGAASGSVAAPTGVSDVAGTAWPAYGSGVVSGAPLPFEEYLAYGGLLYGPAFFSNVLGTNFFGATNFVGTFSNFFATNAAATTGFLARAAFSNFFNSNFATLRSNLPLAFQTNRAAVAATNVTGGPTTNTAGFNRAPATERTGAPGAATGTGTGAGSGSPYAPYRPPTAQPQPPQTQPPVNYPQPVDPFPKRTLPSEAPQVPVPPPPTQRPVPAR